MLVSSAGPEEGKSVISANLAISMAKAGSRTLLIDGDLRRPTLHKALKLNNSIGFSTYLKNGSLLKDVIQDTDVENLKCISSGPLPSNPAELLGSIKTKQLINDLENDFDMIIFDSPPVFGVTDSAVLAKSVEGVIQVVHFGKYHKNMVSQAKQRLKELDINILGVVLNNIDVKRSHYYYYPYYYRYYHDDKSKTRKTKVG